MSDLIQPLTTWRHVNTGNVYVVVKLLKMEQNDIWLDAVEYTSMHRGGKSYVRSLERFAARFVPASEGRPD